MLKEARNTENTDVKLPLYIHPPLFFLLPPRHASLPIWGASQMLILCLEEQLCLVVPYSLEKVHLSLHRFCYFQLREPLSLYRSSLSTPPPPSLELLQLYCISSSISIALFTLPPSSAQLGRVLRNIPYFHNSRSTFQPCISLPG